MKKYIVSIIVLLSICFISLSVSAVEYYDSNEEIINTAAEIFRDKMLNKEETFKVQTQYIAQKDEIFNPNDYIKDIYEKAISEEFSINSSSGDYLKSSLSAIGYNVSIRSTETLDDGTMSYILMLQGNFRYYITKQQEDSLNVQIQNWVNNNINLQNDSDFDKVFKVYKYITENVRYDYTYQKHTAYDAFFNKSSVCQGYAELLYKMLKESGIEGTRIITGTADNGVRIESHAWNIVKLDDTYYYLDSTWDEGIEYSSFWWFLRGLDIFEETHIRGQQYNTEEFNRVYPISNNDFAFITSKITEKDGMISGFDISKDVITEEDLLSNNYFRDDINVDIEIQSNKGIIGTDSRIKIKKDGVLLNSFVVVIYGDINGDGKINAVDALNLIKGINGKIYFENPYVLEAGKIITSESDKPKAVDALAIIKHVNRKFTINQSR